MSNLCPICEIPDAPDGHLTCVFTVVEGAEPIFDELNAELERLKDGQYSLAVWKSMSPEAQAAYATRNKQLWALIRLVFPDADSSAASIDEWVEKVLEEAG